MKLKLQGPGKKRAPNTFNFISNIVLKNFKKIKEIENKKKKMFFYLFSDCTRFFIPFVRFDTEIFRELLKL